MENSVSDLCHLRQEHTELLRVTGRLSELIAAPTPPPAAMLTEVRVQLSETLMPLLQVEDEMVYPRLMASDDPAVASTARRCCDETGGLAAAYSLYARRWATMFIVTNWSGYCQETRAIIDAVNSRIAREAREIYPLLGSLDLVA